MAMLQPDPRDRPAAADCGALLTGPAERSAGADAARPGRGDAAARGAGSRTATSLSADAKGGPSREPDNDEPQVAQAPTETVVVPAPAEKEDRHLLWALTPLLSLGLLMPFPFAESAARKHSARLWLLTLPYVSIWLALLLVIIIQGSLGHLKPSLTAAIWLLALSVIAALNALWLRHRVFRS